MRKTILVTGGAGYIGSAAVRQLVKEHDVIVVDNLSKGLRRLIDKKAKFYKVDLTDKKKLATVFGKEKIDAVIHFASYKAVGESMQDAVKYSQNITGTINLLDLMVAHKVKRIIYSSSAAVYGMPEKTPIDEDFPLRPINYYGYTKQCNEEIIGWYSKVHGLEYVCLRYFNVAGDAGLDYLDPQPENIFPIIMEVMTGKRPTLVIFGKDYETADGTCVRDYIDVTDLVNAHVLALGTDYSGVINLGTSKGVSVLELVKAAEEVSGKRFAWKYGPRRPGDPATLVASNQRAREILSWKPQKTINDMLRSTLSAYKLR
jgi:UDP-glucose 4-epimerase